MRTNSIVDAVNSISLIRRHHPATFLQTSDDATRSLTRQPKSDSCSESCTRSGAYARTSQSQSYAGLISRIAKVKAEKSTRRFVWQRRWQHFTARSFATRHISSLLVRFTLVFLGRIVSTRIGHSSKHNLPSLISTSTLSAYFTFSSIQMEKISSHTIHNEFPRCCFIFIAERDL